MLLWTSNYFGQILTETRLDVNKLLWVPPQHTSSPGTGTRPGGW